MSQVFRLLEDLLVKLIITGNMSSIFELEPRTTIDQLLNEVDPIGRVDLEFALGIAVLRMGYLVLGSSQTVGCMVGSAAFDCFRHIEIEVIDVAVGVKVML